MEESRREIIFVLTRWMATGEFPDRLLEDGPSRGFVQSVVYTVIRNKSALEWVLRQYVKHLPTGEAGAALYAGAAQVLLMDDVADHAAVFETVEAVKQSSRHVAGLLNAVLRRLVRERDDVLARLAKEPVAVRYSHPVVCVKRWTAAFGAEACEALCAWNNRPAQAVLVPLAGFEPCEGLERLEINGRVFFVVPHGMKVSELPGFAEGCFVVQDPATLGAVELLAVGEGMSVLDACAAPGGKAVAMAQLNGNGRFVAMDCHEDRLVQLRDSLARTGLSDRVEVVHGDAAKMPDESAEKFDRVLLDVPCSNSGVFRRRADARWRWSVKRLKRLLELQAKILEAGAAHLVPGGRLVYSTCSIEREENMGQVEAFLVRHPEFTCVEVRESLPWISGTDGAFAAALVRQG